MAEDKKEKKENKEEKKRKKDGRCGLPIEDERIVQSFKINFTNPPRWMMREPKPPSDDQKGAIELSKDQN